jgi:hypothetical protein
MEITIESTAVHNYLNNLQAVINRMAANCASSKAWCITLISAVIVFATDKQKPDAIWISIIPIILFFVLDAYYLGLERKFRHIYNNFIKKLHSSHVEATDIFLMTPPKKPNTLVSTLQAGRSVSVWPFYALIMLLLVILRSWLF